MAVNADMTCNKCGTEMICADLGDRTPFCPHCSGKEGTKHKRNWDVPDSYEHTEEFKPIMYTCGHEGKPVVLDNNALSFIYYFTWKDTTGYYGDKTECHDCYADRVNKGAKKWKEEHENKDMGDKT